MYARSQKAVSKPNRVPFPIIRMFLAFFVPDVRVSLLSTVYKILTTITEYMDMKIQKKPPVIAEPLYYSSKYEEVICSPVVFAGKRLLSN